MLTGAHNPFVSKIKRKEVLIEARGCVRHTGLAKLFLERDHVFIGNQREQLQKEPAHANLPLPSPLMFWGRCLSVDFEGIWGRC